MAYELDREEVISMVASVVDRNVYDTFDSIEKSLSTILDDLEIPDEVRPDVEEVVRAQAQIVIDEIEPMYSGSIGYHKDRMRSVLPPRFSFESEDYI